MTLFTFEPVAADNGFRMDDYWIWCPSIIRGSDGLWNMFASRWPKWLPFHPGWMTHSEVVRAVASTPEGPYTFQEVVLPARGPQYWDGRATHNPTIRFHGGRYYLFYIGSTHPLPGLRQGEAFTLQDPRCIVARSCKRIGVAWADSLHGPWHRSDEPILKTRPGTFYGFLTSNPAPHIHSEGKVTLMFKGRSWKGEVHGPMTIGVATAPTPLGPYSVVSDKPAFPLELFGELEDPFLWCDSEGYKAVAKDMSGQTCGQAGGAVYVRSDDAIHWRLGDPPAAFLRQIRLNDGSTRMLGNVERPFLLRDGDRITHLCAATSNGSTGFGDATETWNMVVPVRLGKA